jgi:extracellular factor (EF) 3-hydroxypalmitic acid methyl ester biosynthesis protein
MTNIFDDAHALVRSGDTVGAFQLLGAPLTRLWGEAVAAGTSQQLREAAQNHALFGIAQEDPYTQRAFTKPRGYAGDAVMMDYVYGESIPDDISPVGREVFFGTTRISMGLSVLHRRRLLQAYIDDTVSTKPSFRILSVASGHCRELAGSLVLDARFAGEFVALDQDPLSCDTVAQHYAHANVKVVNAGVKDLLGARVDLGQFDLVYSAGLFDYLAQPIAQKLVHQLTALLRPAGRLLVANFLPAAYGIGYMECFMDWRLIYRTEQELLQLFPSAAAAATRTFVDPHANVAYAELTLPQTV